MKIIEFFKRLFHIVDKGEIYYINGAQTLPPPLEECEEREAIEGLISPDASVQRECRDKLIEHNLRLVVYIAKKFENTGVGSEDLVSIGTIGLVKALNTFRPDKNIKIATYASKCIENEILMYIRRTGSQRLEVSIDEPLSCDGDGNELLLSDVLGDGTEVHERLEEEEERRMIHLAVSRLKGREREIIERRFGLSGKKEMTQKELADEMGISQSYISRLEKKIIKQLKKDITKQSSIF
ncbi:MAG: sigma-70 family RNA polymerase sigma factor [Clostridia bacterium]|nr:sigma-70 family RNA polymerase sigma factor [Clostridia bacterium]